MPVLSIARARLAFGHLPLLDGADFALDAREHIGLIGRNGSGKSSLLCVLAGLTDLDDGDRWVAPTVRIAFVAQEPSLDPTHTVYEAVAIGLGPEGRVLGEYHEALAALEHAAEDTQRHARVDALQARLESTGWALGHRVENVISRVGLDADARISTLSGGWKKRVALAQALAAEPDVLLLDEPTNHLDIDAITWLEELVRSYPGAVVCVTHDRRFLDAIATRIVELDRGRLRSYPGNFARYQERKAAELNEETLSNARFDKLLAQEETWIRKGIEARRTRNEGRVLRLAELRRERAARRDRLGRINLQVDDAERSGRMVAELSHVTKGFDDCVLIRDFTTRILRGDRIGLIGRNGAGKSTLLKLILGEVDADSGSVRRGTHLDVAYFDQLREQLDPEATLVETISPGGDFIELAGVKRHVMSYLSDFLFPPERARSPVKSLSGGERNRLLLARLFAQPANVLVLDEPTNDLDIETLELLEALLQEYTGTLFLVSHDRAFLDNVVTQTIAFEGDGLLREFAGGYSDWEAWHARQQEAAPSTIPANTNVKPSTAVRNTVGAQPRTGLSYREQQELAALPQEIEAIEQAITALRARFADPALYREHTGEVSALQAELERRELALTAAYAQWEALEARHASDRN